MFLQGTFDAQKRLSKFILKRLIGRFLDEELDVNQLKVRLFQGEVELHKLKLNVEAIHEALSLDVDYLPFRLWSVSLEHIKLAFKYKSTQSSTIEVHGLCIEVEPTYEWHLARKKKLQDRRRRRILREKRRKKKAKGGGDDDGEVDDDGYDSSGLPRGDETDENNVSHTVQQGLSELDSLIEQITSRIKVKATDVTLKIHGMPMRNDEEGCDERNTDSAMLVVNIACIDYDSPDSCSDDTSKFEEENENKDISKGTDNVIGITSTNAAADPDPSIITQKKQLILKGVTVKIVYGDNEGYDVIAKCSDTVDTIATLTLGQRYTGAQQRQHQSPLGSNMNQSFNGNLNVPPPVVDADFFIHSFSVRIKPKSFKAIHNVITQYIKSIEASKEAAKAELAYLSTVVAEATSSDDIKKSTCLSAKDLLLIKSLLPWYDDEVEEETEYGLNSEISNTASTRHEANEGLSVHDSFSSDMFYDCEDEDDGKMSRKASFSSHISRSSFTLLSSPRKSGTHTDSNLQGETSPKKSMQTNMGKKRSRQKIVNQGAYSQQMILRMKVQLPRAQIQILYKDDEDFFDNDEADKTNNNVKDEIEQIVNGWLESEDRPDNLHEDLDNSVPKNANGSERLVIRSMDLNLDCGFGASDASGSISFQRFAVAEILKNSPVCATPENDNMFLHTVLEFNDYKPKQNMNDGEGFNPDYNFVQQLFGPSGHLKITFNSCSNYREQGMGESEVLSQASSSTNSVIVRSTAMIVSWDNALPDRLKHYLPPVSTTGSKSTLTAPLEANAADQNKDESKSPDGDTDEDSNNGWQEFLSNAMAKSNPSIASVTAESSFTFTTPHARIVIRVPQGDSEKKKNLWSKDSIILCLEGVEAYPVNSENDLKLSSSSNDMGFEFDCPKSPSKKNEKDAHVKCSSEFIEPESSVFMVHFENGTGFLHSLGDFDDEYSEDQDQSYVRFFDETVLDNATQFLSIGRHYDCAQENVISPCLRIRTRSPFSDSTHAIKAFEAAKEAAIQARPQYVNRVYQSRSRVAKIFENQGLQMDEKAQDENDENIEEEEDEEEEEPLHLMAERTSARGLSTAETTIWLSLPETAMEFDRAMYHKLVAISNILVATIPSFSGDAIDVGDSDSKPILEMNDSQDSFRDTEDTEDLKLDFERVDSGMNIHIEDNEDNNLDFTPCISAIFLHSEKGKVNIRGESSDEKIDDFVISYYKLKVSQIDTTTLVESLDFSLYESDYEVSKTESASESDLDDEANASVVGSLIPVVYSTKWGRNEFSPPVFQIYVDQPIRVDESCMLDMTVNVAFTGLTWRCRVSSDWMTKLSDFFSSSPLVDSTVDNKNVDTESIGGAITEEALPCFTTLTVQLFDTVIDYCPGNDLSSDKAILQALNLGPGALFTIGSCRLSSNVVFPSDIQGYHITLRDMVLYLNNESPPRLPFEHCCTPSVYDFDSSSTVADSLHPDHIRLTPFVDSRRATNTNQGRTFKGNKITTLPGSLVEFAESMMYAQTASLDIAEIFIRERQKSVKGTGQHNGIPLEVEVSAPNLNVYTCDDTLNTLIELLQRTGGPSESPTVNSEMNKFDTKIGSDFNSPRANTSGVAVKIAGHDLFDRSNSNSSLLKNVDMDAFAPKQKSLAKAVSTTTSTPFPFQDFVIISHRDQVAQADTLETIIRKMGLSATQITEWNKTLVEQNNADSNYIVLLSESLIHDKMAVLREIIGFSRERKDTRRIVTLMDELQGFHIPVEFDNLGNEAIRCMFSCITMEVVLEVFKQFFPAVPENLRSTPTIIHSEFHDVKSILLSKEDSPYLLLAGMEGTGKTSIARKAAIDPQVIGNYRDGIVWLEFGTDEPNITLLRAILGSWLGCEPTTDALRSKLKVGAYLVILDDIWSYESIEAFNLLQEGGNSKFLITSRDEMLCEDLNISFAVITLVGSNNEKSIRNETNFSVTSQVLTDNEGDMKDDQMSAADLRRKYANLSDDQLTASQLRSKYASGSSLGIPSLPSEIGESDSKNSSQEPTAKWYGLVSPTEESTLEGVLTVADSDDDGFVLLEEDDPNDRVPQGHSFAEAEKSMLIMSTMQKTNSLVSPSSMSSGDVLKNNDQVDKEAWNTDCHDNQEAKGVVTGKSNFEHEEQSEDEEPDNISETPVESNMNIYDSSLGDEELVDFQKTEADERRNNIGEEGFEQVDEDEEQELRQTLVRNLEENQRVARAEVEESNVFSVNEMQAANRIYQEYLKNELNNNESNHISEPVLDGGIRQFSEWNEAYATLNVNSEKANTEMESMRNSGANSGRAFWYPGENVKVLPHHMGIPYTAGPGSHIPPASVLEAKLQNCSGVDSKHVSSAGIKAKTTSITTPAGKIDCRFILRDMSMKWRLFGGHDWNASVEKSENDSMKASRTLSKASATCDDTEKGMGLHSESSESNSHIENEKKRKVKNSVLLGALLENYHSAETLSEHFVDTEKTMESSSDVNEYSLPTRIRHPKAKRNLDKMLEIELRHMSCLVDLCSSPVNDENDKSASDDSVGGQYIATSVAVAVRDFEITDFIDTSQINKLLSFWVSDSQHPRVSGSSMLRFALDVVQTENGNEDNTSQEFRLRCSLLPLRVNVDQDALDFLISFFSFGTDQIEDKSLEQEEFEDFDSEFVVNRKKNADGETYTAPSTPKKNSIKAPPDSPFQTSKKNATKHQPIVLTQGGTVDSDHANSTTDSIYFQAVDIRAFKIKVDYWPKRINYGELYEGSAFEAVNLFAYESLEVDLRRVQTHGVNGLDKLAFAVAMSWKDDIIQKQLHKCLAGVAIPPLNTLATVGSSFGGLVLLPLNQYQRDGRIMHGVRKGTSSFMRTVTVEALSTVSKITMATQTLLEHADDIMTPTSTGRSHQSQNNQQLVKQYGKYASIHLSDQPKNVQDGFDKAADSLAKGVKSAVQTVIAVPLREYETSGTSSAVKSAIRGVPIAFLRPIIGATEAMSYTLLGLRNSVDPEIRQNHEQKYKKKN